ncbi:hypothetical protein Acr_10g0001050 [Actinidia rufa]|uniref:Uncharacterized protein n=1 Tax=Actinidia rufa TaxID=165716 RepID=A0A7J0F7Q1_9ERIC|nr:hypothetical protein Acr_10g0001050 [Actinidia rufa]
MLSGGRTRGWSGFVRSWLGPDREPKDARDRPGALGAALVDDPGGVHDSDVEAIDGVRAVAVNVGEVGLDMEPGGDARVAGGEIDEVGTAGRVEHGGGAESGDPVPSRLDAGADVGVGETRNRSLKVWEPEERGLFQVLCESYAVEAEERLATPCSVVVPAVGGRPRDPENVAQIQGARGGGVGGLGGCREGEKEKKEGHQTQAQLQNHHQTQVQLQLHSQIQLNL